MGKTILYILAIAAFFYFYYTHNRKRVHSLRTTTTFDASTLKVAILSYAGESVSLQNNAVPGGVTIFDFYADWCGPCRALAPELESYVRNTPGVFLRKINIKDWESPVVRDYSIHSIPSLRIYDRNGNETDASVRGMDEIKNAVEKLL